MLVIIGTYRRRAYIERCIESIEANLTGITELAFVDDSGDPGNGNWLRRFGRVTETFGAGYNAAMKAVCWTATEFAPRQPFAFVEEDFTIDVPTDLNEMAAILTGRPQLAQVALLRGPHFPIEHQHGGLLEGLQARLGEDANIRLVNDVWEQTGTFTGNPAVWRPEIAELGWPDGEMSEDRKRDQLLKLGYRFGYLPGVRITHDGERSGHDY